MQKTILILLLISALLYPAQGYTKTDSIVKKIIDIGKTDQKGNFSLF